MNDPDATDPFSQRAAPHPALSHSLSITSDIFPDLFGWFFDSEEFHHWCNRRTPWQLHCTGGPGSGKTTLAALTVRHLRRKLQDPEAFVVPVFIHDNVELHEVAFLEDLLRAMYNHMTPPSRFISGESMETYERYDDARMAGRRITTRIGLIREAIYARLKDHHRTYLVLDGMDRCSPTLESLLEQELVTLHARGLSIMTTSRLPVFEKPEDLVDCDRHEGKAENPLLSIYWECAMCDGVVVCFTCKGEGKGCPNDQHGTKYLVEKPEERMNIPVAPIATDYMQNFVAWELEREHGDLQLQSSFPHKPPLSKLGMQIRQDPTGNSAETLLRGIVDRVYGNVALAKLELDLRHNAESIEDLEEAPDRLPRNLVAFFDDGMNEISKQAGLGREVGLKAVAAASRDHEGHPLTHYDGIPREQLESLLRDTFSSQDQLRLPPRSLEDVLRTGKGFLKLRNSEYDVAVFHPLFQSYATEDYNNDILWANSQLRYSKMPRSATHIDPKKDMVESPVAQLEEKFPEILDKVKFDKSSKAIRPTSESIFKLSRAATGFALSERKIKDLSMRKTGT